MPYTKDEDGRLNNFAVEPDEKVANYPTPSTQRLYILGGVVAVLFLGGIFWIAFSVS